MAKYGDGSQYGRGVKYGKSSPPPVVIPPTVDSSKYKHHYKEPKMNDRDAARFDMMKRVGDFGTERVAEFVPVPPSTTPTKAQTLFTALGLSTDDPDAGSTTLMARIKAATKGQQSGAGAYHGGTTSKEVQRDGLLLDLRGIIKSAGAIAEAQGKPEIMDTFRLPHTNSNEVLAATARAIADKAEEMSAAFIELEHPANFVTALRQRVAAFESADSDQNVGQENQQGATASIGPLIQEGLTIVKQLDAIMHNKYRSDAEKMGAWLAASHVERAAVSKKKETPPPTPPTP